LSSLHARRVYRFRAVLPPVPGRTALWCEVDVAATQTLADLAAALMQAFSLERNFSWSFVIGATSNGDVMRSGDAVQDWPARRAHAQLLCDVRFPGHGGWDEFLFVHGDSTRKAVRVRRTSVDAGVAEQTYPHLVAVPTKQQLLTDGAVEQDDQVGLATVLGDIAADAARALHQQETALNALGLDHVQIARILAPLRLLHTRLDRACDQYAAQDVWSVLLPPTQ